MVEQRRQSISSTDQNPNPYFAELPSSNKKKDFLAPELAYSHEKRKLFNKFGYKCYTRNKEYMSQLDKTNPDSNSKPLNSSFLGFQDKSNNNSSFQRNQLKADSTFYESRVSNLLKARNKTQEKSDSGSGPIVSVNAQRRAANIKTAGKRIINKQEVSPLRIFDESMIQMSKASLINDQNLNEQSLYTTCQNEMESQPLLIKKSPVNNITNSKTEQQEMLRNASTRESQHCSSIQMNQSGYSSIKQIQRHSTTVVPSMRGNPRNPNQVLINSLVPQIQGIQSSLLLELYEAKCLDLKINPSKNQMVRFFDMIKRNCLKQGNKLNLADMGLGDNSLKVVAKIVKNNDYFSSLDLRKNFVTGVGLYTLAQALLQNERIVHIDLGCNQINGESAEELFTILQRQNSITSISLANSDCYKYKNKLGNKGAQALGLLLARNHLISMIDLTDNALSSEGICYLMEGVRRNPNMISLNLSQNDIGSGLNTFNSVSSLFKNPKNSPNVAFCPVLEELILSSNQLTNKNIDELTEVLNNCPRINLKRIDLSNNKFSSKGLVGLIQCLKNNPQIKLTHLNFERANLDQGTLSESVQQYKILIKLLFEYLRNNKNLTYLNLSQCYLSNELMQSIGKALQTNDKINTLILRGNKIELDGLRDFFYACSDNQNLQLKILDLSSNKLNDDSGLKLTQALKQVKPLEQLILKDNSFSIESSDAFLFLVKEKPNLWKVQLDLNMIKYMTLLEIEKTCKKNRFMVQKQKLPSIRKEINHLVQKRDPQVKIEHLDRQLQKQKKEIEIGFQYVLEEEEFVHDVMNQGDEEIKELELIKLQLDQEMSLLDDQMQKVDKKIYKKQREWERKIADEQSLVDKCQDHNNRLSMRIEKNKQRNRDRRTQLIKVGEEGKLIEELEALQQEERMLSLIIENYEKEIQRKGPDTNKLVMPTESQNKLQNVLTIEKDLFRTPIIEEKDARRCVSTNKDNQKKKQKKSKGRPSKKGINEKHIKSLVTQIQVGQPQLLVKQK